MTRKQLHIIANCSFSQLLQWICSLSLSLSIKWNTLDSQTSQCLLRKESHISVDSSLPFEALMFRLCLCILQNCTNIECLQISCAVGRLGGGESAVLKVRSRLWAHTFLQVTMATVHLEPSESQHQPLCKNFSFAHVHVCVCYYCVLATYSWPEVKVVFFHLLHLRFWASLSLNLELANTTKLAVTSPHAPSPLWTSVWQTCIIIYGFLQGSWGSRHRSSDLHRKQVIDWVISPVQVFHILFWIF